MINKEIAGELVLLLLLWFCEFVAHILGDKTGTEEAINVQSWCELASFDEIYQGEGFKVKCLKL